MLSQLRKKSSIFFEFGHTLPIKSHQIKQNNVQNLWTSTKAKIGKIWPEYMIINEKMNTDECLDVVDKIVIWWGISDISSIKQLWWCKSCVWNAAHRTHTMVWPVSPWLRLECRFVKTIWGGGGDTGTTITAFVAEKPRTIELLGEKFKEFSIAFQNKNFPAHAFLFIGKYKFPKLSNCILQAQGTLECWELRILSSDFILQNQCDESFTF